MACLVGRPESLTYKYELGFLMPLACDKTADEMSAFGPEQSFKQASRARGAPVFLVWK